MIELLAKGRYLLALLMVVTMPVAILYWYLIHPFAAFWRRLGAAATFIVVGTVCVAIAIWIGSYHRVFLAVRYPFSWPLTALGLVLYVTAAALEVACRRHLKFSILAGVPEVGRDRGRLLTEGIYSRVRNPRYLSVLLGVTGFALILNFPAVYLVALLSAPALWILILLEERELRDRFGAEYEEYMQRVPRLIPRLGPSAEAEADAVHDSGPDPS